MDSYMEEVQDRFIAWAEDRFPGGVGSRTSRGASGIFYDSDMQRMWESYWAATSYADAVKRQEETDG